MSKKLIREQGVSGDWFTEESVEDYNAAIADIEDIPEGGWHAIMAKHKLNRQGFPDQQDTGEPVSISIHDPDFPKDLS